MSSSDPLASMAQVRPLRHTCLRPGQEFLLRGQPTSSGLESPTYLVELKQLRTLLTAEKMASASPCFAGGRINHTSLLMINLSEAKLLLGMDCCS